MSRTPLRNALVLVTVAGLAAPAAAAVRQVDWDSLTWNPPGKLSETYTIGSGNVGVVFTGDTGYFTTIDGQQTPGIDNVITGAISPVEDSLHIRTDYDSGSPTDEISITITFTHPGGVRDVSFSMLDVDTNGSTWIDEIEVTASDGSTTYDPSSINPSGSCVNQLSSNTVEGVCSVGNTDPDGNTSFTFNQIGITSVTIVYRNTISASDPGGQRVSIHDFDFTDEIVDLSLTKTVDNATPPVGSSVVFTIDVSNAAGFTDATGVEVTDLLPNGYAYVSDDGGGAYDDGSGVWAVGNVAAGTTETLNITARVNSSGVYDNAAEVTAANETDLDDTFGNGSGADYDTASTAPITLAIVKKAYRLDGTAILDSSTLAVGARFRFLLYVNNPGGLITDVSMQDVLDPAFAFVTGTIEYANPTPACAAVTCTAIEEDASFAAADGGSPGTEGLDADPISFGGATLDVGNQVIANAQLDVSADSVWAVVFTVTMR